jgi:hypothetical protein
MWDKAVEQSYGEEPVLALRWYSSDRLDVQLDLVAVDPAWLAELLEEARRHD